MKMKKFMAAFLAATTLFVFGCGQADNGGNDNAANTDSGTEVSADSTTTPEENPGAEEPVASVGGDQQIMASFDSGAVKPLGDGDLTLPDVSANYSDVEVLTYNSNGEVVMNNISYVMVYNPLIYTTDSNGRAVPNSLNPGDFSSQIILPGNRAGLEGDGEFTGAIMAQPDAAAIAEAMNGTDREGFRAGAMDPIHKVGEKYTFYHDNDDWSDRTSSVFECIYEGKYCYIWSNAGDVTDKEAKELADEFDKNIFEQEIEAFGTARFTENGGKVSILFHNMNISGLCGYFDPKDLFATPEFYPYTPDDYMYNADHAIIHINTKLLKSDMAETKVTLAHEFQHLICFTDYFAYSTAPDVDVWFNEMMSAYAEELIYPGSGIKSYKDWYFIGSDLYRNGQSLYNFGYEGNDIGCYGVVYLYAKYFDIWTGGEGPRLFHDYWRNSYSENVSVAETIYEITDQKIIDTINTYTYSDDLEKKLGNKYNIWMSKMTLNFYLYTMANGLCQDIDIDTKNNVYYMYNTMDTTKIEGGGRLVMAVKDGSYTIPKNSDHNLFYVGFDKDFNIVVGYLY